LKTHAPGNSTSRAAAGAGPKGRGLAPPAYGMGFVDRGVNAPIQRRMGIEAEMSVPAPLTGPAGTAQQRVTSFLAGSQLAGQNIQPLANGFEIETDHDQVSTEVLNALTQINNHAAMAGAPIALVTPAEKVPNMEYKSQPFDEETAAGRTAFRNTVVAMAADMTARYNAGLAGQLVIGGYTIGLPPLADWNAFGVALGLPAGLVQGAHAAILAQMRPGLYLQVTAGILPKKIGKLMGQAAGNRNVAALNTIIGPPAADAMERLLTSGASDAAWAALGQVPGLTRDQRRSKSLWGYLSLVIAYLYGNYIFWNGGTVDKNLTPFLSKTPLHQIQLELDTAKRPDQWPAARRLALQNAIDAAVVARVGQPDVAPFWPAAAGGHNGGPLGNWRGVWLPGLLLGNNPGGADAFSAAQLAGRTIAPEDHARGKVIAPGPGRVARGAPGAAQKSGVIPLEFRHIEGRPTPAQLLAFVNRMIDFVRMVNGWW
jgi:hypothetical protein